MSRAGSVLLTCVLAVLGSSLPAGAATRRLIRIDVANTASTGDKVRGPVTLRLDRVNRLRYDVSLKRDVVFTPGPDLPLLPALPSAPASAGGAQEKVPGAQLAEGLGVRSAISDAFDKILEEMRRVEGTQSTVEQAVAAAADLARRGRDAVDGLVRASDGVLQGAGPQQLVLQIRQVIPVAEKGQDAQWPSTAIAGFRREADRLAADLDRLPHRFGPEAWAKWYQGLNKVQYDDAVQQADALRAYGDAVGPDSAVLEAFQAIQAGLSGWLPILRAASAEEDDYFILTRTEDCEFGFDNTRATTVTLVAADRLAPPGTGVTRTEVITVECTTPFSVSGGFGYSLFVDEIQFGFVATTRAGTDAQGAPTTRVAKEFAELKRSDFRVSPVVLVNTRIAEWNDTYALHVSAGAVVDVNGDTGTDVEWLAGASVSFKRSLFLTAAFQAARVPKLGGGFTVGNEVPAAIAEPPLEKELRPALFIGITFKLKP